VNAGLGILLILLIVLFVMTEASGLFALLVLVSLAFGFLLILPIGGADMPVVISMLNSYSGWAPAASASPCPTASSSLRARSSAPRAQSSATSCARG